MGIRLTASPATPVATTRSTAAARNAAAGGLASSIAPARAPPSAWPKSPAAIPQVNASVIVPGGAAVWVSASADASQGARPTPKTPNSRASSAVERADASGNAVAASAASSTTKRAWSEDRQRLAP